MTGLLVKLSSKRKKRNNELYCLLHMLRTKGLTEALNPLPLETSSCGLAEIVGACPVLPSQLY